MQSSSEGYCKENTTVGLPRDLRTSVLTHRKPQIAEGTGGVAERVLQKLKHLGMDEDSLRTGCNDVRQSLSLNSTGALAVATGIHPTEFDRMAHEKFQEAMNASRSASVHAPSSSNIELAKNRQENKTQVTSEHNNSETVMAPKQQSEDECTDMSEELTETAPLQENDVQEGQQSNSVFNTEKRRKKKKRKPATKFGELETVIKDIADIVSKARLGGEDRSKEEYTQKIEAALRDVYARVQIVLPQNQDTLRESANISACTEICSSSDGDHNDAAAKEDMAVNSHQPLANQDISVLDAEQLDEANTLSADDQQEPLFAQGKERVQEAEKDALRRKSEDTIDPQGEGHEDLANLISPAGKSGMRRKKKRRRQASALDMCAKTNVDFKGDEEDHDDLKTKLAPRDENRANSSSEDKEDDGMEKVETSAQCPSGEPQNLASSSGSCDLYNTNGNRAKNEEDNTITIRQQLDTSEGGLLIKNEMAASVLHTENKQQLDQADQVTTSKDEDQTKHRDIPNDHITSSMIPAGPGHNVLSQQNHDITKRKRKKKKRQKQSTAIESGASAPSDDSTGSRENCGSPAADDNEVVTKEDEAINNEHDLKNSEESLIHEQLAMSHDQDNTQDKAGNLTELGDKTIVDNEMRKKEDKSAAAPNTGTKISEQSSYEESSVLISKLSFNDENKDENNNVADKDNAVIATQHLDKSGCDEPVGDANEDKAVPDYNQEQLNTAERSTDKASEPEGQNSSQGEQVLVPEFDDHNNKMSSSVSPAADSTLKLPLYIPIRKKRRRRNKKKGNQTADRETNNEDNFTAADDLQISGKVTSGDEGEFDNNSNKDAPKHQGTEEEICLQSSTSEPDSVPSGLVKRDIPDGNEERYANDESNVATQERQPNHSESGLPAEDKKETGVAFEDNPDFPQLFQNQCNMEADEEGEQPIENFTNEEDQTQSVPVEFVSEPPKGDSVPKERLYVRIRKRRKHRKRRRTSTETASKIEATSDMQSSISQSGDRDNEFGDREARKVLYDFPTGTESKVQDLNDDVEISPLKDEARGNHSPDNVSSISLNHLVSLQSPTEERNLSDENALRKNKADNPVIEQQISKSESCLQIQDKHQRSFQAHPSKSSVQVIEPNMEHTTQPLSDHQSSAPFKENQLLYGVDDPIDLVKNITNKGENVPGQLRDNKKSCLPIESKQDGTGKHNGNHQPLVPNSGKESDSVDGEIKQSFLHPVQKDGKQLPAAITDIQSERIYTEDGSINSSEGQESPSVNLPDSDINGNATLLIKVTETVDNVPATIDTVQDECAAAVLPDAEDTDVVTESSYENGHETMADIEKKVSQQLSIEAGFVEVTNKEAANSLHEVDKKITDEVVVLREETSGVKIVHKAGEIVQDVFATAQKTISSYDDEVKVSNRTETPVDQEKRVTQGSSVKKHALVNKDSKVDLLHSSDTDDRSVIVGNQLGASESSVKGFEDEAKTKTLVEDKYLVLSSCINENGETTEEKHDAALAPLIVSQENVADSAANSKGYTTGPAVQSAASHASDDIRIISDVASKVNITDVVGKTRRPQDVKASQNEISGETHADEVKTADSKHTLSDSERMVAPTSSPTKDKENSKHEICLAYDAKEFELQSVNESNNEPKISLKESKEPTEFTDEVELLQKVENYIQEMYAGVRTLLETGAGNNVETTVMALNKVDKDMSMDSAQTEFTDEVELLHKVKNYIQEMYARVRTLLETGAGNNVETTVMALNKVDKDMSMDSAQTEFTDEVELLHKVKNYIQEMYAGVRTLLETGAGNNVETTVMALNKVDKDMSMDSAQTEFTDEVELLHKVKNYIQEMYARVRTLLETGAGNNAETTVMALTKDDKDMPMDTAAQTEFTDEVELLHKVENYIQEMYAWVRSLLETGAGNNAETTVMALTKVDKDMPTDSAAQTEFTDEVELLQKVENYIQDMYARVRTLLETVAGNNAETTLMGLTKVDKEMPMDSSAQTEFTDEVELLQKVENYIQEMYAGVRTLLETGAGNNAETTVMALTKVDKDMPMDSTAQTEFTDEVELLQKVENYIQEMYARVRTLLETGAGNNAETTLMGLTKVDKEMPMDSSAQTEFTDEVELLQKVENYIQEMYAGVRTLLETGAGNNAETTVMALTKVDKDMPMDSTAQTEFTDEVELLQKVENYIQEMYARVRTLLETGAGNNAETTLMGLTKVDKEMPMDSSAQTEFTDEVELLQKVENYIQEMYAGVRTLLETGAGNNAETNVMALTKVDKDMPMDSTAQTEFTDDIKLLQKVNKYINEVYAGVTVHLETDAGVIQRKNTASECIKEDEMVYGGVQQITDPTTDPAVQSTKSHGKVEVKDQVGLTLTIKDVHTFTQQPTTSKLNVDPVNISMEASPRDQRVLLSHVESISVGKDLPSAISSKPIADEAKNKETDHCVKDSERRAGHPSQSVEHEVNHEMCSVNTADEGELKSAEGLNRNDDNITRESTAQVEFTDGRLQREVEVYIQDSHAGVQTSLQTDAGVVKGKNSGSDSITEVVEILNKESCSKSVDSSFPYVDEQTACDSRAIDVAIDAVGDNETAKEIPEYGSTTVSTRKDLEPGLLKAAMNEVPKCSADIENHETETNLQHIRQCSDVNTQALPNDSIDKDGPKQLPQHETISVTGVTTDSTMETTDTDHPLAPDALSHVTSDAESASLPIPERLAPFIDFISLGETKTTDGQDIVILDPSKIPSKREFSGKEPYKNAMEDFLLYAQRFIEETVQTDLFVFTIKSFDERRARLRSRKWALRLYKLLKDRYSARLTKCVLFKPSFKLNALTMLSLPFVSAHMREKIVIVKSHHEYAKAQGLPEETSD